MYKPGRILRAALCDRQPNLVRLHDFVHGFRFAVHMVKRPYTEGAIDKGILAGLDAAELGLLLRLFVLEFADRVVLLHLQHGLMPEVGGHHVQCVRPVLGQRVLGHSSGSVQKQPNVE